MDLRRRKETLDMAYNMCSHECNLVKYNINRYCEEAKQLYDNVASKWNSEKFEEFHLNYDNALSDLICLTDTVRKFNIALSTNTPNICEGITTNLIDNGCGITNNIPETYRAITTNIPEKYCAITSKIPDKCSSDNQRQQIEIVPEKYTFLKASLKNYNPGYEADCILTFIQDASHKLFFMTETNTEYTGQILNMQQYLNQNRHVEKRIPEEGEIFGISLENHFFRAVRENGILKDKHEFHIYLLDVGEEIACNNNIEMYSLPAYYQMMPAQAILCELKSFNSSEEKNLSEYLSNSLYTRHRFFVRNNRGHFLEVELDRNLNPFRCTELQPSLNDVKEVSLVNNEKQTTVSELTAEELNILYEEPLCTTNAMKAVMGYDPRDDKRICQFYDGRTGSCFKGALCRFEHVKKLEDGWTRDQAPVTIDIQSKLVYPNIGDSITLIPTHVANVEEFFAHLNTAAARYKPTTLKQLHFRMNSPEHRALYKKIVGLPVKLELVLAMYRDDSFYRARVLTVIDDDTVKVFYLDYGNSDIVSLCNVRKWEPKFSDLPFQAIHCRLSGVSEKKSCLPEATEQLRRMVLNKSVSAEVVDNIDQLHVRLFDVDGFEIAEQLIGMELANPKHVYPPLLRNQMIPA